MTATHDARLQQIQQARRHVLLEGSAPAQAAVHDRHERAWLERSWRRCLAAGRRPEQPVTFDAVGAAQARGTEEQARELLQAARPVMSRLVRAIAGTRYFAILTDARGRVVGVDGPVDRGDRRAQLITRIGTDLSERAVGTTAIGAALAELQPVWLHRAEHFHDDTGCYSCAGAPLFGPDGECVGMLDLTGIDAAERPELKHLVAQSARGIENALALARPHALTLHLNWPGRTLGAEDDGLVCLDADGWVAGSNAAAREMASQLQQRGARVHCSELVAMPWERLFDAARHAGAIEVPLWSGLTLQVAARPAGEPAAAARATTDGLGVRRVPLKDLEAELIRKTVDDTRGNVMEAARLLGISRATVYRKLGARARD